ncbi:MAG: amino acid adenylation domain-containing protein [Legionellaceae bacterium]|nr:amino acid adenylation domain-containing protein [Legionellaceae bacterium]
MSADQRTSIQAIYKASSLQQGFIYRALHHPEDHTYSIQAIVDYQQALDCVSYEKAWELAIATYPALRVCFNWEELPIQIIMNKGYLTFAEHDISEEQNQEEEILRIREADLALRFDLTQPTLFRINLIKQDETHYSVLKTAHHSILDGWSIGLLWMKVHEYYIQLCAGETPVIQEEPTYLLVQRYMAKNQSLAADYWKNFTKKTRFANDLNIFFAQPIDLQRHRISVETKALTLCLYPNEYSLLKRVTSEMGITFHTLIQFAWHKLIHIYTQDQETIVGTVVSGRELPIEGIETSVGFYINTLPLSINWEAETTIRQQLEAVYQQITKLLKYSFIPLATLQSEGRPLFHSLVGHQNYPMQYVDTEKLIICQHRYTIERLDYPLALMISENFNQLELTLKYNQDCLTHEIAKRLLQFLQLILQQVPEKLDKPHTTINLLTHDEYHQMIIGWNKTEMIYPNHMSIHQLFAEQVKKNPHKTALIFKGQKTTYEELHQKSNQLAHFIRKQYQYKDKAPRSDIFFAVCMHRSSEMIIAILGILKSGAAYVPIDPDTPKARIEHILKETQAKRVFGQDFNDSLYQYESKKDLELMNTPDDLAYVIYTSGTTGLPKGVMISHRSVVNYFMNVLLYLPPNIERFDFSTSIAFDLSITTTIVPLLAGRSVIVYDGVQANLEDYIQHLYTYDIDFIKLTPSYLNQVFSHPDIPHIKVCFSGGEPIKKAHLQQILKRTGDFYDEYGPTETTVGASIAHKNELKMAKSIGKPYGNYTFYVLDSEMNPLPVGAIGELYIGGLGLARGYLGQEVNENFVINPFVSEQRGSNQLSRLYKTGDLVRWTPDGCLEYINRNDFQIKVNGYRIELGEIETVLRQHGDVKDVVVCATEDSSEKQLVAYIVADIFLPSENELLAFLAEYLPSYMSPTSFIFLEKIPLLGNGKVDRKALLALHIKSNLPIYTAPRDELEVSICDIWKAVFNLQQIGIKDNFLRLGGHSILAIQIAQRISQLTKRKVQLVDILNYPTILQLSEFIRTQTRLQHIPVVEESRTLMSFGQERLWFIDQYEGGTDAYHIPILVRLDESIDKCKLIDALQHIIQRHSILRTCFKLSENGQYLQEITEQQLVVEEQIDTGEFIHRLFDLTQNLPVRAGFYIDLSTQENYLLIVCHHIVFDAWSENLLNHELWNYYYDKPLKSLSIQYKDFAIWHRENVEKHLDDLVHYWQNKLTGLTFFDLPSDYPRPLHMTYRGDFVHFKIPKSLSAQLKLLAQTQEVTLFTLLLSTFALLLSRYTHQKDLLIGTPTAMRQHPQLADLIGLFLNTLVIRIQLDSNATLKEYLYAMQMIISEAQAHQDLPFEKLIECLKVERDTSRHPLFQVMFTVQHQDARNTNLFGDNYQAAKFDLEMFIQVSDHEITGSIQYATALFKHETIERMAKHYEHLLQMMVNEENQSIGTYTLLTQAEYQQIVIDWNDTSRTYPKNKLIHQLFEEQVNVMPNKVAVIFEHQQLTYQALNVKSNQLARYLQKKYSLHLKQEPCIAICMDRSLEMIIAIMGVLKTGAAYIPIDPTHPQDRIDYILKETNALCILENTLIDSTFDNESSDNIISIGGSDRLAYVMYTSGSTGKPKGVMVPHRGIINRISWMQAKYSLHDTDVVLQKTPYGFDVSVWELFWPLMYGAKMVIAKPEGHKDSRYLQELIRNHVITIIHFVPSMLSEFCNQQIPESLRHVFCSGETLSISQVNAFYASSKHTAQLHNLYGPTEASIDVTSFDCHDGLASVHIGKAIYNTQLYVLNDELQPVPIGIPGELYIGGVGLAHGYFSQPELTKERFISNPFSSGVLYRTGDIVRWLADGNLTFIGRKDFQVKIRGHRIELGEVEHVLLSHSEIEQSVVIAKNTTLIAYYISKKPQEKTELYKYLAKYLPEYMLPTHLIALNNFPLTINGKVDRKALLFVEGDVDSDPYCPPKTQKEKVLCGIWMEVLKIEQIGVHDDFFRLGGDSILSIQLVVKMKASGINVTVRELFTFRTISGVLKECTKKQIQQPDQQQIYRPFMLISPKTRVDIYKLYQKSYKNIEDIYPASALQQRMLNTSLKHQKMRVYHNVFLYRIMANFDEERLLLTWKALIQKHALLRTAYIKNDNHGYLSIQYEHITIEHQYTKISGAIDNNIIIDNEKQIVFPFEKPGLFRILISFIKENEFTFVFSFHHAIADGWSMSHMMNEFMEAYLYERKVQKEVLPQYAQLVMKELSVAEDVKYADFWATYLSNYNRAYGEFLSDQEQCSSTKQITLTQNLTIDQGLRLLMHAKKLAISPDVILFGLYLLALSEVFDTSDIVVGLIVNNRLEEAGWDKVFGLHWNMIPFRMNVKQEDLVYEKLFRWIDKEKIRLHEYKNYPCHKINMNETDSDFYQCAFNYMHFHVIEHFYQDGRLVWEGGFERLSIPMCLNVVRFGSSFQLILKVEQSLIHKKVAQRVLSLMKHYCDKIEDKERILNDP